MLAVSEFFENTWQSLAQTSPITSTNGASLDPNAIGIPSVFAVGSKNYTMTNFGVPSVVGVTTTATVNGITSPQPVVVQADFSLWCPVLGVFVRPEDTNLLTKLSE